jgi:hypothetical protein
MNGPSLDAIQERQAKFRAGRTFYRCGMFTQGFVDFTFSKGRKLRITRFMPPILCGKTVLCLKRGPNQKRSGNYSPELRTDASRSSIGRDIVP